MRVGFAASVAAHVVLIGAVLIGFREAEPLKPQNIEAISVDLVPVSELASIRAGSEQSDVIDTPAPSVVETKTAPKIATRTGSTEKDQPRPQETDTPSPAPTVQTAPNPAPEPEPAPKPVPEVAPKPAPTPTPPQKAEPKPEPAATPLTTQDEPTPQEVAPQPVAQTADLARLRADFKQTQDEAAKKQAVQEQQTEAKQAQEVADIINSEASRGATTGTGGQQSAGQATGQAQKLTQSELGALIAQMRRCWNPTLAERNNGVVIQLLVSLDRQGNVTGMPQILTDITGQPMLGLSARTAARKVMACGPFVLPPDKYSAWKTIDVTLDASQAN